MKVVINKHNYKIKTKHNYTIATLLKQSEYRYKKFLVNDTIIYSYSTFVYIYTFFTIWYAPEKTLEKHYLIHNSDF